MGELEQLVVMVTGAAQGHGLAVAERCIDQGATVVMTDIISDVGRPEAERLGATYIELDVTSEAAWAEAVVAIVDSHGRIDVLVNNAGIVHDRTIVDSTLDDFMSVIAVNQVGTWLGMRAVIPTMIEMGSGSIVNIGSIDGIRGVAGHSAYCAAKHAVIGLTRSVALEVAPHGVRVNCINPGGMLTPILASVDPETTDLGVIPKRIPAGRLAGPAEVARVVAFIASPAASYCTGSDITIDGGWTIGYSRS
jgi:3alpha(or 20beta)-hydroxysteroid dehydrogenase